MSQSFWRGRRVLVTGHTGFKGGWLSLWLSGLGAEVHGFALPPPTQPSLHDVCGIGRYLASETLADIGEPRAITETLNRVEPEIVIHLAAQPLVRASYVDPIGTFLTNVMGVAHLLEGVRSTPSVRAVVNVTTDKCYEAREWVWPYREDEALGGYDPYSSSKACAELVTAAYRRSFLAPGGVHLATARAGNVIGGGDWAADRLVPDLLRGADRQISTPIRSPQAVRPWQHVLEPLSGYLALAEALVTQGAEFAHAWNFGPSEDDAKPVHWIADRIVATIPGAAWHHDQAPHPHEAQTLRLDSSRARARLGWRPRWTLDTALEQTMAWHLAWRGGQDLAAVTRAQIEAFVGAARP